MQNDNPNCLLVLWGSTANLILITSRELNSLVLSCDAKESMLTGGKTPLCVGRRT